MHRNLFKLLGRAGVYLEENNDDGKQNDGGKEPTAEEVAAAAKKVEDDAKAAKEAADALEAKQKAEKDGTKPSDAEAKLLKEVMALKAKQKAADEELKAYKDAAGESKPEELKQLIEAKKEAERLALEKRGEYDRILEQVKTEHQKELKELQDKLAASELLISQKDDNLVELTVGRAFSDSPFIRDKSLIPASLARKEFGSHVDIVDGAAVVYDKPRGATDRTPLVDSTGKAKSFEDGIQALYSVHPEASALIRSGNKPGSGPNTTQTGTRKPGDNKEVSPGADRIAAGLRAREAAKKKQ